MKPETKVKAGIAVALAMVALSLFTASKPIYHTPKHPTHVSKKNN
jgi:hypothetical protein